MNLKKKKKGARSQRASCGERTGDAVSHSKILSIGHMADCEHMFPICSFKLVTCACDRAAFVTRRINTNMCYSTAQFTLSTLPEQSIEVEGKQP